MGKGEVRDRWSRAARLMAGAAVLFLLASCAAPGAHRAEGDGGGKLPRVGYSHEQVEALFLRQLEEWQGTPYLYGGLSRRGIDCSGFVYVTFRDELGVQLPRSTKSLVRTGVKTGRRHLAAGDLVFFKTGLFDRHVGMYAGESRFIHASLSRGVTLSSLEEGYWRRRFWKARRVIDLP